MLRKFFVSVQADFTKFSQWPNNLGTIQEPADPSQFNDPVAAKTKWVSTGGQPPMHKLFQTADHRIEFRATTVSVIVDLVFFLIGIGVSIGFSYLLISQCINVWGSKVETSIYDLIFPSIGVILGVILGLRLSILSMQMLYYSIAPTIFDKQIGYLWKGKKTPNQVTDKETIKTCVPLSQIHALQLISEHCSQDKSFFSHKYKSTFDSYELNVVLEDGQRLNLLRRNKPDKIRQDGEKLSQFLEKKLWDAI